MATVYADYSIGDSVVSMNANGDFVVNWLNSTGPSVTANILERVYNGGSFGAVTTVASGSSYSSALAYPSVAMNDYGSIVHSYLVGPVLGTGDIYLDGSLLSTGAFISPGKRHVAIANNGDRVAAWQGYGDSGYGNYGYHS